MSIIHVVNFAFHESFLNYHINKKKLSQSTITLLIIAMLLVNPISVYFAESHAFKYKRFGGYHKNICGGEFTQFLEGSPSSHLNIQAGEKIISFDDILLTDYLSVKKHIKNLPANSVVEMKTESGTYSLPTYYNEKSRRHMIGIHYKHILCEK